MIDTHGFPTTYGRNLLADVALDTWIAVVHPEPWAHVRHQLQRPPAHVVDAGPLDVDHLDDVVAEVRASLAGVEDATVVGIGGGTAMDTAKWLHQRLGLRLVQVPSVPSVNACFTRMTALRDGARVRYEGDSVPDVVLVDLDLVGTAPRHFVSGGIGDVLSCHTALHDWAIGDSAGRDDPWENTAAEASRAYLDELEDLAPDLATGDDDALIRLMECHRDIGWRCHQLGHARFEEGSEHFFAYSFEEVTGRTIMHGELVTLGVIIMSALQGNDPERPRRIARAAGARTDPAELGIHADEIDATLRRLPQHVIEHERWYSVANELTIDDQALAAAHDALAAANGT